MLGEFATAVAVTAIIAGVVLKSVKVYVDHELYGKWKWRLVCKCGFVNKSGIAFQHISPSRYICEQCGESDGFSSKIGRMRFYYRWEWK